jgi:hypothetical protein
MNNWTSLVRHVMRGGDAVSSDTAFLPEEKIFAVFVMILLGLLVGTVSFVAGADYAVQKHEDMYCPRPVHERFDVVTPDPSSADVPRGCRNGEEWDE